MSKLFDLSGRVAVITGSTKGMGLEMARALGQQGARVVVSGRDGAVSERVAATLKAEGIDATGIPCDIADLVSVRAFADKVLSTFGRVDALLLNAAASGVVGSMLEQGEKEFDDVMAGNVRGNFVLVNALAPQMIERRDGSIVFMSSIAGRRGSAFLPLYRRLQGRHRRRDAQLRADAGAAQHQREQHQPGPGAHRFFARRAVGIPSARRP